VVNIASRSAGFISKRFDGRLGAELPEPGAVRASSSPPASPSPRPTTSASSAAPCARSWPWRTAPTSTSTSRRPGWSPSRRAATPKLQAICTQGLNLFRLLIGWLKPILPGTAEAAEQFLRIPPLTWAALAEPLLDHEIAKFKPLMTRVDPKADRGHAGGIEGRPGRGIGGAKPPGRGPRRPTEGHLAEDPIAETIDFDAFAKVDLRIARIAKAAPVEGADKLLR
jgi:methionyl-tRNA synthetase